MKIAIETDMIYCRIKELIAEKEFREKRKITYKVIQDETGLSPVTISKLFRFDGIQRIDGSTLEKLCEFFQCQVGDILKYFPQEFLDQYPHSTISELSNLPDDVIENLQNPYFGKDDEPGN